MTTKKTQPSATGLVVSVLLITLTVSLVFAQLTQPLSPTSATFVQNYTRTNVSGYYINDSRAHIWVYNFAQNQISTRWKGYVGNVTGSFVLSDASNNALYSWTVGTTTGEVYATKWDPADGNQGTPSWTNVACANVGNRTGERTFFSHTTYDEDSFENTWQNGTTDAFNHSAIYVGETLVAADTCFGVNLYSSNAASTESWVQVLLQDDQCDSTEAGNCNVIYTSLLENNTVGFNGVTFDYQMLLPEQNANGTPASTAYWFYVELQ